MEWAKRSLPQVPFCITWKTPNTKTRHTFPRSRALMKTSLYGSTSSRFATWRLYTAQQEGGVPLIEILDRTVTPMGSRQLRKWMILPLKEKAAIEERLFDR